MPDEIYKIHDAFFKAVYEIKEEASAFFQGYMPEIINPVDLNTLEQVKKTYVDEDLRQTESDLLYRAKLKDSERDIFFYFLFEHHSKPDKWIRYRGGKYEFRIWDDFIDEYRTEQTLKKATKKDSLKNEVEKKLDKVQRDLKSEEGTSEDESAEEAKTKKSQKMPKKLPPIALCIFYQGKEKWNYSTEFSELIDWEGPEKWIPSFSHFLVDQSDYGPEQFKGELKGKVAQLLMKMAHHGLMQDELDVLREWLEQQREIDKTSSGKSYSKLFIKYLIETQKLTLEEALAIFNKKTENTEIKEDIMTLADQLRLDGKTEGKKEGKIGMVENLLRIKFREEAETWISRLPEYTETSLDKIGERILLENTLEKVFKDLEKK